LPLGRTEEDPFRLGDMGLPHQHIQFGNGTFDPLLALDVSRSFGRLQAAAYGQAQLTLYANTKGFQAGSRLFAGLSAGGRVAEKLIVMPRSRSSPRAASGGMARCDRTETSAAPSSSLASR
jgi:hypothetical protein